MNFNPSDGNMSFPNADYMEPMDVTDNSHQQRNGRSQAKKPRVIIKCEVCKVDLSSQTLLESHQKGAKHQRKLKSADLMKTLEQTETGIERDQMSGDIKCTVCAVTVSSPELYRTHIAGNKHKQKEKSADFMRTLEDSENSFERDTVSGSIKCTVCDVTLNSPQLLTTHIAGNKHKLKTGKRESSEPSGGSPAKKQRAGVTGKASLFNSSNGAGNNSQSNGADLDIEVPDYVTKLMDTKGGGKFICNPCKAHCNSTQQLSQHLVSKKHKEKISKNKSNEDSS